MRNLALALVVVGLVACGRSKSREAVPQRDAEKILESTPWLDRAPESEEDVIHAWIFPRGEGLYFTGNAHKGSYETFRYWIDDARIKLKFLSDGSKHEMKFKIERVNDRTFDYKLTLDRSPRGPQVYYGFEQHRTLPDRVRAVISHLPN